MTRWIIGVLIAAAAVAVLAYTSLQQNRFECTACVVFKGRPRSCATAAAAERMEAQRSAISVACATVSGGVTEVIACGDIEPVSLVCEGLFED